MITFHTLYQSPLISVRDYQCRACKGGPAGEEQSDHNSIVLLRHGVFCQHFGKRTITSDVNQATFFTLGSTYRVSHPADCGDRGTTFAVSQRVLNDIIRELDPTIDDHPHQPFSMSSGPCHDEVFWRHRDLVLRLERKEPLEPIWADVTALQMMADVLEAAFARQGKPRRRRRAGTEADHIERAEAARSYLASRFSERITLDDVAQAVHASPFHLARMFQQRTGMPVHRYLTRLRLRASLERLANQHTDLTRLALDLGFSSHSHFTDAFRKEFGYAPSKLRQQATGKLLRQMSKNLEV